MDFPLEYLTNAPFVPILSVARRNKGIAITASQMKEIDSGGEVRVFAAGGTYADVDVVDIPGGRYIDSPSVIVKARGNVDVAFWNGKFTHKNEIWSYTPIVEDLNAKFLFFYLKTKVAELQALANMTSGKLPQLSVSATDGIKIPLPSISIQNYIVEILDNFIKLEAELEAELEARRRQYAFYRKEIYLAHGRRWGEVDLGSAATVVSGIGFPKAFQGKSVGEIPFYKVSDMNSCENQAFMTKSCNYVSSADVSLLKGKVHPSGTVLFPKIGAAIATNKKRILASPALFDNNVMGVVAGKRILPAYLYHFMGTFDLIQISSDSGAVPSIRKASVEQIKIPLPPVEEQKRVSDTLDKFDALVNDISIGLPAEIAARRKQYEYYRDRLLAFEGE
ncbi:restriction endonuclease subunit S [Dermabacteraceae bacterium P7074]